MPDPVQPVDLTDYLARPSEAEMQFRRLFRPHEELVICDIGACEGEDSVRYARLCPHARVFAFEPLPANQALVRANFARYATSNTELVPLALSDRAGEATFHVSSGRPADLFAGEQWNYGNKSSSLLQPAQSGPMHGWIEFKETIRVPTQTLEAFCADRGISRIDFIQMDVQGAEQWVLAGAGAMLPRITAIWLEVSTQELYRGQALDRDLTRFMRAHGFALAHESYRGHATGEGDHLYLNLRHLRTWPYALASRGRGALRRARRLAGRARSAFSS
ncbi:MAG: FkbM family methyltransferase [Lacunisphaera sp.]|nr:FkbM family methyltransferase [Lacunisphaera sp.]